MSRVLGQSDNYLHPARARVEERIDFVLVRARGCGTGLVVAIVMKPE
jgi:hypothetical protein